MEWLLCIIVLVFASALLFEKITAFLELLHSFSKGKLLSGVKTISIALKIRVSDKKSEACATNTDSITNRLDKGS